MTRVPAASAATPSLALISDGQSRRLAQLIEIRGLCLSALHARIVRNPDVSPDGTRLLAEMLLAVEPDNIEIRDAFAAITKLDELIGDRKLMQPSAVAVAAAEVGP